MVKPKRHILVCLEQRDPSHPKGSCYEKHGHLLFEKLRSVIEKRGLVHEVRVTPTGCLGPCSEACAMVVYPDAVWYGKVRISDVSEIVEEHIVKGRPVQRLVLSDELLD